MLRCRGCERVVGDESVQCRHCGTFYPTRNAHPQVGKRMRTRDGKREGIVEQVRELPFATYVYFVPDPSLPNPEVCHRIQDLVEVPTPERTVKCFQLWRGNDDESGVWDTSLISVPADTPDDALDNAVRRAISQRKQPEGTAKLVGAGYYGEYEEEKDDGNNT